MAFDTELCTQVLRVVNSCISSWIRRRARDYLELQSVKGLQTGCVTFIQRWRSDLALNPHLHILFIDGVYIENDDEPPVFRAIPGPLRKDLEHVASRIAVRLRRIAGSEDSNSAVHELAEAEPLLAACGAASVQKRIATGARAGQRVRTVHVPTQDEKAAVGGLCAQVDGVNIHAGVRVPASDRGRLERLVRYVARSPIAANRLRVDDNGDVIYELKRVWSDGSVAVRLSPVEFLEKLAALVPRPWSNQHRYFGVLASNSRLRPDVVPRRPDESQSTQGASTRCPWIPWAELLQRVFKIDVTVCGRCGGGPVRVIACIMEREAIRAILKSHGSRDEPPARSPARQLSLQLGDAA